MTLQERKSLFIARATAKYDSPAARKEAAELFDRVNGGGEDEPEGNR